MPKSDTWPGGIAMETMTSMDSEGSCDSVVSMNSGCSDDSLEHLSAEERACLMFLEETIESLETEDDSGLSNDESDCLPASGNVANKTAHLSVSMSNSKLNNGSRHPCEEPPREGGKVRSRPGYLVPTPLVLANGTSSILPKCPRPGLPPDKENFHPKPRGVSSSSSSDNNKRSPGQPPCVPSEVNVVVLPPPPPPTKPKDSPPGRVSEGGASSRGPLSYEALVQLRKSASMKKTPHSPAAGEYKQQPSVSTGPPVHPHHGGGSSLPRTPSSSHTPPAHTALSREPSSSSSRQHSAPVVAPKPRRIPTLTHPSPQKIQNGPPPPTASHASVPAMPGGERRPSDPQRVRMEALIKLGLMRDQGEPDAKPDAADAAAPPSKTRSHSVWDITQHTKSLGVLDVQGPPRGGRPVQSSTSFNHPRSEKQPTPQPATALSYLVRPVGAKAATLERSGVGLGSLVSSQPPSYPLSASLGSQPPSYPLSASLGSQPPSYPLSASLGSQPPSYPLSASLGSQPPSYPLSASLGIQPSSYPLSACLGIQPPSSYPLSVSLGSQPLSYPLSASLGSQPPSYPLSASLGSQPPSYPLSVSLGSQPPSYPLSASLGSQRSDRHCLPPPVPIRAPETVKTAASAAPQSSVPHKRSSPPAFSVAMEPGMGEDRKEALRKLGLLKD